MIVDVFNLSTGEFIGTWSCTPREAVVAAYAQDLGDSNTWEYKTKYDHLVRTGQCTAGCGDFTAMKE